ncbi:holo-ACP synthase [Chloroflexota bacterium]
MLCIGTDLIEVARIQKALDRWGERFLNRIYTGHEQEICSQNAERLASRFAGKEAVMKALGTGAIGISWREIEIATESTGKPLVRLYGKARQKADSIGLDELVISLSDTSEYAMASVIGEIK